MSRRDLDDARRKFAERIREASRTTMYGIVKAVNAAARTCDVEVGEVVYEGVLLYAVEPASLKGFVALPKIGSAVLVSRVESSERLWVSMHSEIDKVVFTVGDRVTMTCDGETITADVPKIVINGGDLGGLLNIEQLTTKINEVIDALNTHTHQILPGGVAVIGTATAQQNVAPVSVPAPMAKHPAVKRNDYEDTKVTH